LEINPLWDKRVKVLQVTNTSEKTIEVRALMSASSSGNAFDLRCDVREGLVKFIQVNYPNSFPVTRAIVEGPGRESLIQRAKEGPGIPETGKNRESEATVKGSETGKLE
jgi:hypothetical protein